jgi:hypothetical protein
MKQNYRLAKLAKLAKLAILARFSKLTVSTPLGLSTIEFQLVNYFIYNEL